jgi:hypothetical protein
MGTHEKSQRRLALSLTNIPLKKILLLFADLGFFAHITDAPRTHVLADQTPVFQHLNTLNVRFELTLGPAHRVAYIVPKLGRFAANFTLRHVLMPHDALFNSANAMLP